jgi:hypothetical protein
MTKAHDESDTALLCVLTAITRIATSLYGPGKARKQITGASWIHNAQAPLLTRHLSIVACCTDAYGETYFTSDAYKILNALQSEHAALAILRDAVEEQMRAFGTVRSCCFVPGRRCWKYYATVRVDSRVVRRC